MTGKKRSKWRNECPMTWWNRYRWFNESKSEMMKDPTRVSKSGMYVRMPMMRMESVPAPLDPSPSRCILTLNRDDCHFRVKSIDYKFQQLSSPLLSSPPSHPSIINPHVTNSSHFPDLNNILLLSPSHVSPLTKRLKRPNIVKLDEESITAWMEPMDTLWLYQDQLF